MVQAFQDPPLCVSIEFPHKFNFLFISAQKRHRAVCAEEEVGGAGIQGLSEQELYGEGKEGWGPVVAGRAGHKDEPPSCTSSYTWAPCLKGAGSWTTEDILQISFYSPE